MTEERDVFRLTRVVLKSGEFALFINGHYLTSDDGAGAQLQMMTESLSRLPGVKMEDIAWPDAVGTGFSWKDIGSAAIQPYLPRPKGTIGDLATYLLQYPVDTLCLSSLWFAEDFLSLDDTLTPHEIGQAMDAAEDRHDANFGLNWESLQAAIDYIKSE